MKAVWEHFTGEKGKRYILLLLAAGLVLLLLPSGSEREALDEETEETRIASFLSDITGVGTVNVLLSETGAAVVCTGAESPSVALDITEAVCVYTGLGADRVKIFLRE